LTISARPRRGTLGFASSTRIKDDAIHHGIIRNKSDDLHLSSALGTNQRIDLVDFPDHLGPALAWDSRSLLLNEDKGMLIGLGLSPLAPVGVGVEAVIPHGNLALVWNMGSDPGDELQIIHPLHLFRFFPIPVADFPLPFIKGEAFQGQKRMDHVFADSLSLLPVFGPDLTVDRKTRVSPSCDLLHQGL